MFIRKNLYFIFSFFLIFLFQKTAYNQENCNDSIFNAIKANDKVKIKNIIDSKVSLKIADENGASPLMWAAFKCDLETFKLLVKAGADVKKKGILFIQNDYYYGNLTGIAAGEGKIDILKYLIEGCSINVDDKELHYEDTTNQGWTALQWACAKGDLKIAKYLISKGANINTNHTSDGITPLMYAVQINNYDVVKFLLSKKANPNLPDKDGYYPIHHAVYNINLEMVKLLIKYGANPTFTANNGYNSLHFAAYKNYTDVVPLLLSKGISINDKTSNGDTPLIIAIENNGFEFADYIIKNGADINIETIGNWQPIHLAARQGSLDILKILISNKVNINAQTSTGETALYLAAYNNEIRCVNFLIQNGARKDLTDSLGKTPLDKAIEFNYLKVIDLLTKNVAFVDEPEWEEINTKYLECNKLQNYSDALKLALIALIEAEKEFGKTQPNYAKALNNLGFAFINLNNNDSAEYYISKAIEVLKTNLYGDSANLITYYLNLADVKTNKKKFDDAENCYLSAIQLADVYYKNDVKAHYEIYVMLAQFYEKLSYYKSAMLYYNVAIENYEKNLLYSNPTYHVALNNLGSVYDNLNNKFLAEQTMLKCLRIREQFTGTNNLNYANTLNNLAVFYENEQRYDEAEKFHFESLKIRKKINGKNSIEYALALQNLASLYVGIKDYAKAKPLMIECNNIFETTNSTNLHYYAITLKGLANIANAEGKFDLEEQYFLKALKIRKQNLNENHLYVLNSYSDLASFYLERYQLKKCDSVLAICMQILKSNNDTISDNYLSIIGKQASLFIYQDKFNDAELKYKEAYNLAKILYDSTSSTFISYANALGSFYYYIEDYKKAKLIYEPLMRININKYTSIPSSYLAIGTQYTRIIQQLNNRKQSDSLAQFFVNFFENQTDKIKYDIPNTVTAIANCYKQLGKFEKAEQHYILALSLMEKKYGKFNQDYIVTNNVLADYYQSIGKSELAIKTYFESMLLAEKVFGVNSVKYANNIDNLGTQYMNNGQYDKAEQLLLKSYQIKSAISDSSKDILASVSNLGKLYQNLGQYEKSGKFLLKNLALVKKIYGKEHPEYGHALNNLCILLKEMDFTKGVDTLYFKVIENFKNNYGDSSMQYATALHNLASYYVDIKNDAKADSLFDVVLNLEQKIFKYDKTKYYNTLNSIAVQKFKQKKYTEAELLYIDIYKILEKKYGKFNPQTVTITTNLALLYQEIGNINKAQYWFGITNDNLKLQIQNFYPTLSEQEKQQFFTMISSKFELINSFAMRNYSSNNAMSSIIYNNILATRSILLESTKKIKYFASMSNDSTIHSLYNEWMDKFNYLGQIQLYTAVERESLGINFEEVKEQVNNLEKKLTLKFQETNKDFTSNVKDWVELKKYLSKEQALVDFVKIRYHNGKDWTDTTYYLALIITNDCQYPIMVRLTDENKLNKRILFSDKKTLSSYIYQMLWQPIENLISNKKNLYVSCDGLVNLISFDGLKDKNAIYLTDKYNIHYLLSNRNIKNILTNESNSFHLSTAVLFGGADFDLSINEMISYAHQEKNEQNLLAMSQNNVRRGAKRGEPWEYLPGTFQEIDTIQKIFINNAIATQTFVYKSATEENFKSFDATKQADIIHIATHGFYIPIEKNSKKADDYENINDNPLLRSGLILSGGNNAWQGSNPPEIIDDGILSAYEVSNMNLFNTKLVVLSACETGVGDIKSGEGVFGLKRAFKLAGVNNLLISLWDIPDKETAEMMTIFYEQIVKNQSIFNSFKYAQRAMRNKYPNQPELWAGFILVE